MGNCMSSGAAEVSDEDKRRHREAEKSLKEVRVETTTLSIILPHICVFLESRPLLCTPNLLICY
jgi:hypothetical protein